MKSIRSVIVRTLACGAMAAGLWWTQVHGQQASGAIDYDRPFDARIAGERALPAPPPSAAQAEAIQALNRSMPALAVTYDERFGVTRSVMNRQGYLTSPDDRDHLAIALEYVQANTALLGLQEQDLLGYEITDVVPNLTTGSTHVYLRQTWQGIPLYNAQLHVNINREGRIVSVNNAFVPMLSNAVNVMAPAVSAAQAVSGASAHLGRALDEPPAAVSESFSATQETTLAHRGISLEPIKAQLMFLPIQQGRVRLVWNFQIQTLDSRHAFDFTVDADSGDIWTRFDWMSSSQYTVYQRPVESPNHTSPAPPADGRTVQANPENLVASPFGWHDTNGAAGAEFTITRGNNVHAYEDQNNDNSPPAVDVDCGPSLLCNFPINLAGVPSTYVPAAVTNLFYWNNIIHDVQYQYGFTEAAGNFQVNNYGRGGIGNDDVRAEALDGAGTNNANFFTPTDGQRPRMQMFVWTSASPSRTSDIDSGVIVHEYGHGISNRLVGGPANVSCLQNAQQPGEGLSDWWALAYTAKVGDTGAMGRGMGTYLLNQATTGSGIRGQRYSTDPAINTWTYESINSFSGPHAIGQVWAQAAWEVYWALTNKYGFDPNLYNALGGAGNQRAMLYVNEGLMNAACSPTFTDVRDGMLQAAIDNFGGQDVCLLWDTFAAYGLGADAISGGSNSTSVSNGFAVPFFCLPAPPPIVSIGDTSVGEGAGTANVMLSLSGARPYPVSVRYSTADHTAQSANGGVTHANPAPISIPLGGVATPYPSSITVPTPPENVTGVTVKLHGFTHSFLFDLNVLLVGPAGQKILLMANVPLGSGYTGDLTFSDTGQPFVLGLPSGVVRPTGGSASLPGPAPIGPYAGTLSSLIGTSLTGSWSLYIYDRFTPDSGAVAGGWSLTFNSGDYIPPIGGSVTFAAGVTTIPIAIPIVNDTSGEANESFFVNVTSVSNATITDTQAIVTILDNDGGPPPPPPNPLGDLVIDFGGAGLWQLRNPATAPAFVALHGSNPAVIAGANLDGNPTRDLAAVFPGFGLYALMNSSSWVPLHVLEPTHLEAADLDGNGIDDLVANFAGAGLWAWMNNAAWVNLHAVNPTTLASGNIDGDGANRVDLIAGFGPSGIWVWKNHTAWAPVHPGNATKLRAGDLDGNGKAEILAELTGVGLWLYYNDTSWSPLLASNAVAAAIGNVDGDPLNKADVVVSFAGFGTWVWLNNSSWVQIHGIAAPLIVTTNLDANAAADIVLVFPTFGLWAFMNNSAYVQLHVTDPQAVVAGRFDGS